MQIWYAFSKSSSMTEYQLTKLSGGNDFDVVERPFADEAEYKSRRCFLIITFVEMTIFGQ